MKGAASRPPVATDSDAYARWLSASQSVWWKRVVDVQAPYRWNLRRHRLGSVLEIGCGVGRNLAHLQGRGVGIDHNAAAVEIARARGLRAYLPEEFARESQPRFDSLLCSHVLEHMSEPEASALLAEYLVRLKPGGTVLLITPQERGFASDPSHVAFMDFAALRRILANVGLHFEREYSFPFPRQAGHVFRYNEFVCVGRS
jgi:2-polyprenyl-3-methyl-5-hydroxy-6-metoxy-1,4-benzoquinol methylase